MVVPALFYNKFGQDARVASEGDGPTGFHGFSQNQGDKAVCCVPSRILWNVFFGSIYSNAVVVVVIVPVV